MSHDGLSARAGTGVHATWADRRASLGRSSILRHLVPAAAAISVALAFVGCNAAATPSGAVAGASGTPTTSGAAPSVEPSMEASPSAAPSAPTQLTVAIRSTNGSNVFGGAIFNQQADGSTAVSIGLVAVGATDPLPATIQTGACVDLAGAGGGSGGASASPEASGAASLPAASAPAASSGASAAPTPPPNPVPSPVSGPPFQLNPVSGGASASAVQSDIGTLTTSPLAIVIARSAADPTVVACGDLNGGVGPAASSEPSAAPSVEPSTEASAPAAS